jgi:uncharacterized CHY-type Zn-finger protein
VIRRCIKCHLTWNEDDYETYYASKANEIMCGTCLIRWVISPAYKICLKYINELNEEMAMKVLLMWVEGEL